MELKEYQTIIEKTAVYPKHLGIAYTFIGLTEELGELQEKIEMDEHLKNSAVPSESVSQILKEIGDCIWYITASCNELSMPLEGVFVFTRMPSGSPSESCDVAINLLVHNMGYVKKFLRDGGTDNRAAVEQLLTRLYDLLESIAMHYGFTIEEVLQMNYDKLMKRRETNTLHGSGDNREEQ